MSKMKGYLAMAMAMSLMAYGDNRFSGGGGESPITGTKFKVRPKGTKEYYFTVGGSCDTEKWDDRDYEFSCFAINEKNAIKKYKSWKKNKSQ